VTRRVPARARSPSDSLCHQRVSPIDCSNYYFRPNLIIVETWSPTRVELCQGSRTVRPQRHRPKPWLPE
jgi:hypothetical protein